MFIVIEGDNGSGKTTLGKVLGNYGYHNITDDKEIKALELAVKKNPINSLERIESFLSYNFICGKKCEEIQDSLLIRYWISTLAAAYADEVYSKKEVLKKIDEITKKFNMPDLFVYLECDYNERIQRIEYRNLLEGNSGDDISAYRDYRYREIISVIEQKLTNFVRIQVTNINIDKLVEIIMAHLESLRIEANDK